MIKKLIPAAVLLSIMGAAQAQVAAPAVTLYGVIDMSYGKTLADDALGMKAGFHSGGDVAPGAYGESGGSAYGNSTTRIGVKGSADLGSGVKGNFKFETGGITGSGDVNPGGNFFNRAAWAGFSGDFGEVRLGKQDSVPFQAAVGLDLNGASNSASAQYNALVGTWQTGRQSESLQYISPVRGGFKVQAGFVPEGNTVGAKATYSGSVSYAQGPVAFSATHETSRADGSNSFSSVAGNYDLGVVKLMAGYARGAYGTSAKGPTLGVVAPVAGFNIGMNMSRNTVADATATEFFVNRQIFKNTYAYFDYGHLDKNVTDASFVNTTVGATTFNPSGIWAPAGSAYALGVIYVF